MFCEVKVLLQGHNKSEARKIMHIIIYVDAQILQNLENSFSGRKHIL